MKISPKLPFLTMDDKEYSCEKVEFYSGGRRDEKPIAFILEGKRVIIHSIIRVEKIGCPIPEGGYHKKIVVETEDGTIWEMQEEPSSPGGWIVQHRNQTDL